MTVEIPHADLLKAAERFYKSRLDEHITWFDFVGTGLGRMIIRETDRQYYFEVLERTARRIHMLNSVHYETLIRAWLINHMEITHGH